MQECGTLMVVYTQVSNRCHNRTGYLFQGRFKGILVDRDAYLLELSRYVILNPVRTGMVASSSQWPWSSYQAMIGEAPLPKWLAVDRFLSQLGIVRAKARRRYRRFVLEGEGQGNWECLRQQTYLGDEKFVKRMQTKAQTDGDALPFHGHNAVHPRPLSQTLPRVTRSGTPLSSLLML